MTASWVTGDTRAVTALIPDGSVDLIVTSPPFLALRAYLPADHPDKALEIGSEATPAAFLDVLLDLTTEWRRVLAPHGSICVELGDTYSGSGGAGGDYGEGGMRDLQPRFEGSGSKHRMESAKPGTNSRLAAGPGWPLAKSLCMIPQLYAASLSYGRNLLTGREIEPWRVRNIVRWCRPNPPVGALGDKFRPATSEMTIACVSGSRYFDLDAVRGPSSPNTHACTARGVESRPNSGKAADDEGRGGNFSTLDVVHDTAGAPPLDFWVIPTAPYKGSHYATFPPALVEKPIQAMCPRKVCRVCGKPSERIVENLGDYAVNDAQGGPKGSPLGSGRNGDPGRFGTAAILTLGWSDCGHDAWRNGLVFDPFAGSGTTGAVAVGYGRDFIGLDLDARNADLARERIGPMFFTEHALEDVSGLFSGESEPV